MNENTDDTHKRIKSCFKSFTDINFMTDKHVTEITRKKQIDIAIDLMCYTGEANRFGVFLNIVAPIQINFLGYPGTSGSNCIDYIIADKNLILEDEKKFYSEKIVYLPDTYQPNEEKKKISDNKLEKKDLGLPDNKFIFCCFNGHQKITPIIFKTWMGILREAKDSLLWLLKDNNFSEKNLKEYAIKENIDPSRIIFAKRLRLDQHLERLKFADLFIDSFPYNAHTTCSDALRMNIPVVTLKGNSFPSRVASSLLKTLNMDELITNNLKDYKKKILEIYHNKKYQDQLKDQIIKNKEKSNQLGYYLLNNFYKFHDKLKDQIIKNKEKSNLFKTEIFTKNIEKAYHEIYKNYLRGNSTIDLIL